MSNRSLLFRGGLFFSLGLVVVHLAWATLEIGGEDLVHLETRVVVLVAALATMAACIRAARATVWATRRGWSLLALTAASWSASNALAAFAEIVQDERLPAPTPADLPSLLGAVLAVLAIMSFLESVLSSAGRMRSLLDGLLIASSFVFVGWALLIEPVVQANPTTAEGGARVLSLAYPVSDMVLLAILLVTFTRVSTRRTWLLLTAGLGLLTLGHSAFAYLEVSGADYPASLNSLSWVAGSLLIMLAALAPDTEFQPVSSDQKAGGLLDIFVPLAPVLFAGAIGLQRQWRGNFTTFYMVGGGVIATLLIARQLLAQFEFLELNRVLEGRVLARTAELARQEQQFRALVQNASDVVTVVDSTGNIRYQSASSERLLGYRFGELAGSSVLDIVHPDAKEKMLERLRTAPAPPQPPGMIETLFRRKDGSWSLTETTVSNLLGQDSVRGLLMTTRDIGQRRALENQLRQQALHDPLTGLANRILFTDRLRHAVDRANRDPEMLSVLLIDLDGFKQVNDSLGHSAGDQLLVTVAQRLLDSVRPGDTVARMGGDEFSVLLERSKEEGPTVVAQRILYQLRKTVVIDGKPLVCAGSVGVASGATTAFGAEELLRNADLAMYEAKSRGKGVFAVYVPEMHSAALQRVELEADFRRGMNKGELLLHFQPLVQIPEGRVSGAEALVRWAHPKRGLVPPMDFVPMAEESDLVQPLGRWVLKEACQYATRFAKMVPGTFMMAVNVSSRQLTSQWLAKEVGEALEETGFPAESLVLEITEGALMAEAGPVMATLTSLRELGCKLAIDDFGTGWSSLSRLRSFPVDKLKIDKSFIQEITSADSDAPIVAAIVAMAHSLHLTTVAEGAETPEQVSLLQTLGCEEVQGYYYSKPLPAADFERYLSTQPQQVPVMAPAALDGDVARIVAGVAAGSAEAVSSVLSRLHTETGANAVFITDVVGDEQVVRDIEGDGSLAIAAGDRQPWVRSACDRLMELGQRRTEDLASDMPETTFAAKGVRCFVSVPVMSEGVLQGTLCAASHEPAGLRSDTTAVLEMFSRLIVGEPAAA